MNYSISYENLPRRTLTKYGVDGSVQDTISFGTPVAGADPGVERREKPAFPVIYDFQPKGVSNVGESRIVDGDTISDTFTASADPTYGNGRWIEIDGAPVPVKFEATAYYVGNTPVAQTANVPQDAEIIGTQVVTFNGPGSQTVTLPTNGKKGFVHWVWEVVKANQDQTVNDGGENVRVSQLVHADWSDNFGVVEETTSIRHEIDVDSTASFRKTKDGIYLVDDVWVRGFPEGWGTFQGSHGFGADGGKITHKLLFFPAGLEVTEENKANAEADSFCYPPSRKWLQDVRWRP